MVMWIKNETTHFFSSFVLVVEDQGETDKLMSGNFNLLSSVNKVLDWEDWFNGGYETEDHQPSKFKY